MIFDFLYKKKTYKNVDINGLKEAIAYLETNPTVECNPYPQYDGRICTVLNSLGFDDELYSKVEKVKDKPVEAMSLDDLKVMYSFIQRGERFCDGAIKGYVEDGTLLNMARQEMKLLEDGNDL